MQMKRELGEKGQVVVPKDIRDYFNMQPGTTVVFEVKGNQIVITPEKSGEEFLKDFLDVPKPKKRISWKEMEKTYEEQYQERFRHTARKKR